MFLQFPASGRLLLVLLVQPGSGSVEALANVDLQHLTTTLHNTVDFTRGKRCFMGRGIPPCVSLCSFRARNFRNGTISPAS